jgi:hypothetical protein
MFIGLTSYLFGVPYPNSTEAATYFSDFLSSHLITSQSPMILALIGFLLSILAFSFYYHHGEYVSKFDYLAHQFNSMSFDHYSITMEIDNNMLNFVEDCFALKLAENELFKYTIVSSVSVILKIHQELGWEKYRIAFYPWKNIREQVESIITTNDQNTVNLFSKHFLLLRSNSALLSKLQRTHDYKF